jgi:hypothetical protein
MDQRYIHCVVDYEDRNKFAWCCESEAGMFVHRGRILNVKLCFDDKLLSVSHDIKHEMGHDFYNFFPRCKLEGK